QRCELRDVLEPKQTVLEIDADAIVFQELRADDAPELKAEKNAWCIEIQHHDGKVLVLNLVEGEIDAWQQERILFPPRCAPHLQRNAAHIRLGDDVRRSLTDRDDLPTCVHDEIRRMPSAHHTPDGRQAIEPER